MKKILKVFVLSAILTVIFAFPAFAQEITVQKDIITLDRFLVELNTNNQNVYNGLQSFMAVQVDPVAANAHAQKVYNELYNYNKWRFGNFVEYKKTVVWNLREVERIKKEIVTNYKWLSQYNPQFANLISGAEADYAKAVAERQQAEVDLAVAQQTMQQMFP